MSEGHGGPGVIDLNADVGEDPEALADGREEALLRVVTSANVACGAHAGDDATMAAVLALAARLGVAAGAHPGYPDRAGFGRDSLGMTPAAIEDSVFKQVRVLTEAAGRANCRLVHVKPHGALYHDATHDPEVAAAIARGVSRSGLGMVLVGLAGSTMLDVFREHGFEVAAEAFADRVYEADGTLRSRKLEGALITDPSRAAAQAVRIARKGLVASSDGRDVAVRARTICVHGDTPGAASIAAAVRVALKANGVRLVQLGVADS
ncbi:MAG TPA: 5-oxoprolinase subunit PxpA [Thermoanaerobaculaceae bacterium]|nr:5-oxoprolinase subunit PxpA [Thermoanaerobaculaceae bacterium]